MTTFSKLLDALYRIQGAADPNHPTTSLEERMAEIFAIASQMMQESDYQPEN